MWILETRNEGDEVLRFRLGSGHVKTLGRATRADFIIDAALVSRIHCRLTANPSGELIVEDLRSTNGTFVNNCRVKRHALQSGDRLRLGRIEVSVQQESEDASGGPTGEIETAGSDGTSGLRAMR